jgi:hypothetical protein
MTVHISIFLLANSTAAVTARIQDSRDSPLLTDIVGSILPVEVVYHYIA